MFGRDICSEKVGTRLRQERSRCIVNQYGVADEKLASEIVNPKRTDGIKPIEVLGRMKEFDFFVRNSETPTGIFVTLAESPPNDALQVAAKYKD